MSANFNQLLGLLKQILESFHIFLELMRQGHTMAQSVILPEKLLFKDEVIKYLRSSSRSYDRYKQKGILQVMRLGNQDYITPEALMAALQESTRKGKI